MVKLVPKEPMYIEGRLVAYIMCHESREDIEKKKTRMREIAVKNRVKVIRESATGDIRYYDSVESAARATGISQSAVSKCINGHQKTAGGYKFKKMEVRDETGNT